MGRAFPCFIQQALTLVNDIDTVQEVITTLSSEGGLARLGEMLNRNWNDLIDDALQVVFKEQLLPFMRIVAHETVLSSSVLETRHATLLNYLYGVNGRRSVSVFGAVIRGLTYDDEQAAADFEPCLIALSAMLETNTTAQVNDDLRAVVETMIALAVDHALSGNSLKYHRKMCLRLGLGGSIKVVENKKQDETHKPRPTFELSADQPGDLSEHGARHDNDFTKIEDIQILPTIGEILGDRAEYLPGSDPSTWHLPGVIGLLDRQFRLIREDTVGQLRDAAKVELDRIHNHRVKSMVTKQSGARTHSYHHVRLVDAEFDERKGVLCVLQFSQPHELDGKTAAQRQEWWDESKRLGPEALIMLLGSDQVAVFLTVATTALPTGSESNITKTESPIEKRYPRSGDGNVAYAVVQLANHTEADIETVLFRFGLGDGQSGAELSFSLLEFPGVLLPAFQHTLVALQQMTQSRDLPFPELLAPTEDAKQGKRFGKPAYTKKRNFRYNLSTLSSEGQKLELDVDCPMDASTLSNQTELDNAQAQALISTLSRSMALIQGPPGTGKSYTGVALMKVLMANKAIASLGPVLCVTFTNHALDQILEHLVDASVKQIIRIGSRSKSERLIPLNLRTVARNESLTKLEKKERWQCKSELERYGRSMNNNLTQLRNAYSESSMLSFLEKEYPAYHSQLSEPEIDESGFRVVKSKKTAKGLAAWLQGSLQSPSTPQNGGSIDIFSLTKVQRQRLHMTWKEAIAEPIQRSLLANHKAYGDAKARFDQIRAEVDLRVLTNANVIGVTTSGLARNLNLLRRLNSKVLLVEEAGEVLEAHMLTALLPSIEHAILIGDHQQLRPKAQNYELSCENPRSQIKLDISLFERLVSPEGGGDSAVPYVTLEVQRRMHPSISALVRSTLYPNLQDSPQVCDYPGVSGMRQRLFWLDHSHLEDGESAASDTTSHTNKYEVDIVFALVRHLVRQGVYEASDIAVLTPYLGQLRKLRRSLSGFAEIVINDRDSDELVLHDHDCKENGDEITSEVATRARLPPRSGVRKSTLLQSLRLATCDNFQFVKLYTISHV